MDLTSRRWLHGGLVSLGGLLLLALLLAYWSPRVPGLWRPEPLPVTILAVLLPAVLLTVVSVRAFRTDRDPDELVGELLDAADDPTLVLDADDQVAWLNDAAASAFDVDADAATGRDRETVVGDTLVPVESDSTEPSGGEEYRLGADGRRSRRLVRRRRAIEDGQFAGGRIERYVDVTEERGAVAALESVASLAGTERPGTTAELLDAGRARLDAEYAAFTRLDGERTVETVRSDATVGDSPPLLHERSVREVREAGAVRTGYRGSGAEESTGGFEFDHGAAPSFDAFVAAPVTADGDVVGVVTFLSRSDTPFVAWERAVVELLAGWAGVIQTAGADSERALDHERERLEFVDRIVRHNVLNGLNLVNARVDHIDVDDPEAAEHLSVIESRIDETTDLIDTIRAFMDATRSGRERALEPVPVRSALAEQLSQAAETFDASFRVHDLPGDDVRVRADELVGEVFENVLDNAVEHNDREEPTVEVWTTRSTERLSAPAPDSTAATDGTRALGDGGETEQSTLTVHVADDGPGIPDAEKRRLLQHGEADLADPDHGFGLYLVRETMESYGGDVRIRDADPRGTVVELVFPVEG